jgi:class 3 adenylate cyclase/TolB-like protein/Flp pilus assembly protein TadD
MSETRKLAAILVSDVVGYSRLAGADEERTLARLRGLRGDLIDPAIAAHHGRIVKRTGDGSIVEFRSVVDAVRCAIEVQSGLSERNAGLPTDRRIEFRVGIHLGDVVEEEDGDLMGDGVNIAARLEGIAKPGAICLSEDAYRQVKRRFEIAVSDLGATRLKNIAEPIRVYSLDVGAPAKRETFVQQGTNLAIASAHGLLRRPALAAALAIGLAAAGAFGWHSGFAPRWLNRSIAQDKLATAPRLSIVVLPFENLSGDPDQKYFVDGITDDLTTDLSRVPDSFVIARNTALTYKGKAVDAKEIGRDLGVRYLLEGSVHRTGETVEVNAQLVSTETGAHVWADRFEAERGNVGRLQFEVVARIAHSLGEELIKAESLRAIRERPKNPDAIDLATRGEAILLSNSFNKSAWNDAINLFERALTLDPRNLTAMSALAVALGVRADNHWSEDPAGDIARAEELTSAAMALEPDNTWVHWAKARLFASKQQWRSALAETETAIADDRNNSRAYADAGYYKMHLGHSQDGLADVETALRLDPHSNQAAQWQTHLCSLRAHLAQWEQAIEQCEKAVAAAPWDNAALGDLAAAYASAGYDKEAKEIAVKLGERDPNFIQSVRKSMDAHDDPTFKAECARIIEGLRKAGAPEGPAKTN